MISAAKDAFMFAAMLLVAISVGIGIASLVMFWGLLAGQTRLVE